MPYYDFECQQCGTSFERKLLSENYLAPTTEACPDCETEGSVEYRPFPVGLGDPIKLGVTRPPDAFTHGVLGRIQNSVPVGTEKGKDGKAKVKYANFSKARYSPGRLV
jgi:putative FmdB family regulatory protein